MVITGPMETYSDRPLTPVEGCIGRRMPAISISQQTGASKKSVHEGILMKRCRVSFAVSNKLTRALLETVLHSAMSYLTVYTRCVYTT